MRFPYLVTTLAALTIAACSGPPADRRGEIVERLIPEEPRGTLQKEELFESNPVFSWRFESPDDLRAWTLDDLSQARATPGGLRCVADTARPRLDREVDLAAGSIHVIEVDMPKSRVAVELYWARGDEDFSEERRLTVKTEDQPRREKVFRFEVAAHPRWRDRITRLRLIPTAAPGGAVQVVSIEGIRRAPRSEKLAAAIEESWKVDLGAELRDAWLAVPGIDIRRRVSVGEDARLGFAYGLEAAVIEPVRFVVEAGGEGGAPRTLFSRELTMAEAGRWFEASVDLAAGAGGDLDLVFRTESPEPPDLGRGFPVWGHPEILGRREGEGPPNVILISVDTLRADRLSSYGHSRRTSPNLDRWAAERAARFEDAVVQATWTLPSHVSMFTGLDALRHGVNHFSAAPASLTMLAEVLRGAGYTTVAVTGGGYLRPQFGFAQGFDRFRYWPRIMAKEELAQGMEKTLAWLDEHGHRRFFLFFHTYEVHYPYRPRQPYYSRLALDEERSQPPTVVEMRDRLWPKGSLKWGGAYLVVRRPGSSEFVEGLTDDEVRDVGLMYDSSIAYLDHQLGRLLQHPEVVGLSGRTLIVLTSDHGEALGEDGKVGHNYLKEHNVRVPLVIELPDGLGAGRTIKDQVRSIDVVPTILDALGIAPPAPLDGVSLLPLIRGEPDNVPAEAWTYAASANFGLSLRYRNRLKFIFNDSAWSELLGSEELYDLSRDPGEEHDLAATSEETERLREMAKAWIGQHHTGLLLEIGNRGPGVLRGRLEGAWRDHARLKAVDPGCRCLTWEGGSGVFLLEPGQRTTLVFERPFGDRLGLAGSLESAGGRKEFQESFDPLEITDEPVALAFLEGAWRKVETGTEGATGFELRKVGVAAHETSGAPPVDPETVRQLRALGYAGE